MNADVSAGKKGKLKKEQKRFFKMCHEKKNLKKSKLGAHYHYNQIFEENLFPLNVDFGKVGSS